MEEIWRDIEDWEGKYQASTLGRIRSVDHYGYSKRRKIQNRFFKGKILKPETLSGKERYMLYDDNCVKKRYMGHILVAKTFPEICGEWFKGCHVHHKDCNRLNNRPENLICLTPEEHQHIHTQMGQHKGDKNFWYGKHLSEKHKQREARAKRKPIIQMDLEGNEIMGWFSCTDCARETGMDKSAINRCCLGKQHSSYGYMWRYAS